MRTSATTRSRPPARSQASSSGRRLSEATAERPSVLREAGLTALQVWDALGQGAGRIPVKADLTILFTDLVEFSNWSMKAGDAAAVDLLRKVSQAIEPPVAENTGKVVKRLGDGMMAVFADPLDALSATKEAQIRLEEIEVSGYRPVLRAGMHVGRPERVGDDYFGVDVNIAARVAEAATGGEILATDKVLSESTRRLGQGEAQAHVPRQGRPDRDQGLFDSRRVADRAGAWHRAWHRGAGASRAASPSAPRTPRR